MADRIVYAICDDSCKFETMTKEEILAAIEQALEQGYVSDPSGAVFSKIKEIRANNTVQIWAGTEAQFNAISPAPEVGNAIVRVGKNGVLYLCSDDTLVQDIVAHMSDKGNPHNTKPSDIGAAEAEHKHEASDITSGSLPIVHGGHGSTTAEGARKALGITPQNIGAVPSAGGDMTGNLHIKLNYGGVYLADGDGNVNGYINGSKDGNGIRRVRLAVHGTNADFYEYYAAPVSTSGLSAHKYYDLLTSKNPVTVAQGGTGADNGGDAHSNLGLEIDHGTINVTTAARTYSFNRPFSRVPTVVATSTNSNCMPIVGAITKTSFSVLLVPINNSVASDADVTWLAVLNKNNLEPGV